MTTLSTVCIALALLPMPYAYFVLLRFLLCITAAMGFVRARSDGNEAWMWIYGAIAVLYNPVAPVHLGLKAVWIMLNIATVIVFWMGTAAFAKVRRPAEPACEPSSDA